MKRITQWLTVSIAILACTASAGGLLIRGLYRDPDVIKMAWKANDLVTLLLCPVLVGMFWLHKAGNEKATLLWLGTLLYMFYNYAFYLFGAAFNPFFIVYTAVFTLSMYALLAGLTGINPMAIRRESGNSLRGRIISVFLLLVAIPLAMVELGQYVDFILYNKTPQIPTLVLALDLALVIPNATLAAVLMWRQNAWGRVLAAMMLVKSFTYGLVLTLATLLIGRSTGGWDPLLPYYAFVFTGGFFFLWLLLRELKTYHGIRISAK